MTGHIDRLRRGTPVVLLGARSHSGRMHQDVYERMGLPVYDIDLTDHPLQHWEHQLPWPDAVVDDCTPTSQRTRSMIWAYECGARRFLVDGPAASTLAAWQTLLDHLPGSRVLGVHTYLYSSAFRAARAELPDVHRIISCFNRLRTDDPTGCRRNRLGPRPHVVGVEMPNQFAMALSVCPQLEVVEMAEHTYGDRGHRLGTAVACSVRLAGGGTTALLSSNLRAPRQRWVRLETADGRYVHCDFPVAGGGSRAYKGDGRGVVTLLFAGQDDMLQTCLSAAVHTFSAGDPPPPDLSVTLLTSVERCIDHALSRSDALEATPQAAV